MIRFFRAIDLTFAKVVALLLSVTLICMVTLTLLQVILRGFFNSGIPNAEILTRHMVLWIAFLGAMLGTRLRRHISIDVITRMLPRRPRNTLRILLDGVACVVSAMLANASFAFVVDERILGSMLTATIPAWWAQAMIPFGFAMIALEYAIGVVLDVKRIWMMGAAEHRAGNWRKYTST